MSKRFSFLSLLIISTLIIVTVCITLIPGSAFAAEDKVEYYSLNTVLIGSYIHKGKPYTIEDKLYCEVSDPEAEGGSYTSQTKITEIVSSDPSVISVEKVSGGFTVRAAGTGTAELTITYEDYHDHAVHHQKSAEIKNLDVYYSWDVDISDGKDAWDDLPVGKTRTFTVYAVQYGFDTASHTYVEKAADTDKVLSVEWNYESMMNGFGNNVPQAIITPDKNKCRVEAQKVTEEIYLNGDITFNSADKEEIIGSDGFQFVFDITAGRLADPKVKLTNVNKGVRISWTPVKKANGYFIYRTPGPNYSGQDIGLTENDEWDLIGTVNNGKKTKFVDKYTANGERYTYMVRAFTDTKLSNLVKARTFRLDTPVITRKKAGKKTLSLKWKKNGSASGYQVRYSYNAKFSKAKTVKVKGAKKNSFKIRKLKKGRRCYIKVRSFKKKGGKIYYSAWSAVKKAKTR